MGTRAPSTMPAEIRFRQEGEVFRQHVAGLEVGHDQDWAWPATADLIPLILAASGSIALSNASGPSSKAPVI